MHGKFATVNELKKNMRQVCKNTCNRWQNTLQQVVSTVLTEKVRGSHSPEVIFQIKWHALYIQIKLKFLLFLVYYLSI